MKFHHIRGAAFAVWMAVAAAAQAGTVVQTANLNLSRTDDNVTNACGNPDGGGNACVGYHFVSSSPQFNPFDTNLGILTSAKLQLSVQGTVNATGFGSVSMSYGSVTDLGTFSPNTSSTVLLDLTAELDLLSLGAVTGGAPFAPYMFRGNLNHTGFYPANVSMSAVGNFQLTYEYRLRDDDGDPGQPLPVPGSLALLGGALAAWMAAARRRNRRA